MCIFVYVLCSWANLNIYAINIRVLVKSYKNKIY